MNRIAPSAGRRGTDLAEYAPVSRGPTADQVAAAGQMSEEDRQAFIRSMVERLAGRMQETPGDLDGWMRLGNAYSVLGETDNAKDAYNKAKDLATDLPQNDPRKGAIDQALSQLGA